MNGYNMGGVCVTCPYYRRERPKKGASAGETGFMYCEMARFNFPDKHSRRLLVYKYCCNNGRAEDGTVCTVKQILDIHYDSEEKSGN